MLLTIVALLIAAALFVLFSPLRAALQFSWSVEHAGGRFVGSFLHPGVVAVVIDIATRDFSLRLFGRSIGKEARSSEENGLLPQPDGATCRQNDDAAAIVDDTKEKNSPGEQQVAAATTDATVPESADLSGPSPHVGDSASARRTAAKPSRTTATVESDEPPSAPATDIPPPPEENVAAAKQKKDNWFERLRRNRYVFFIGNASWRGKVLRWVARVVRAFFRIVSFDTFMLSVRAGVEDPMLLGTITGWHRAACGALAAKQPAAIRFEPVFMKNHFESTGTIGIQTSLMRLLFPLLVAVATFPALHTAFLWWRFHRLEKRRVGGVVR